MRFTFAVLLALSGCAYEASSWTPAGNSSGRCEARPRTGRCRWGGRRSRAENCSRPTWKGTRRYTLPAPRLLSNSAARLAVSKTLTAFPLQRPKSPHTHRSSLTTNHRNRGRALSDPPTPLEALSSSYLEFASRCQLAYESQSGLPQRPGRPTNSAEYAKLILIAESAESGGRSILGNNDSKSGSQAPSGRRPTYASPAR